MARHLTTTEAGYGAEHQRERARIAPTVDEGQAWCAEVVCLEELDGRTRWIRPGTPWHLAHARGQVGYLGPAHRRCNLDEQARRRMGRPDPVPVEAPSVWWRP